MVQCLLSVHKAVGWNVSAIKEKSMNGRLIFKCITNVNK